MEMREDAAVVDFGAPEYMVVGISRREWVCPGVLRQSWYAIEGAERIVRVKLIIPSRELITEMNLNREFIWGVGPMLRLS